ncbi:histone-like nucleoid-structuring protein Lsr2, partial [Streptomyces sp. NPDC059618]
SYDAKAVRAWAADNGYEVSDRGRIPLEILTAYEDRQR